MASYKVSKAWHFGHSLALDVHATVGKLPADDHFRLADHLRESAATAPLKLMDSIKAKAEHEKRECYIQARQAMIDLHEQLMQARDKRYIGPELFDRLASQAIRVHRLLNELISSSQTAAANE